MCKAGTDHMGRQESFPERVLLDLEGGISLRRADWLSGGTNTGKPTLQGNNTGREMGDVV